MASLEANTILNLSNILFFIGLLYWHTICKDSGKTTLTRGERVKWSNRPTTLTRWAIEMLVALALLWTAVGAQHLSQATACGSQLPAVEAGDNLSDAEKSNSRLSDQCSAIS
ncbi:MAG: hypothetical protein R3200_10980, partial [Xanthomonadales bacterium]|nr:hypothetical protein [Xanthomonadales bacterium]